MEYQASAGTSEKVDAGWDSDVSFVLAVPPAAAGTSAAEQEVIVKRQTIQIAIERERNRFFMLVPPFAIYSRAIATFLSHFVIEICWGQFFSQVRQRMQSEAFPFAGAMEAYTGPIFQPSDGNRLYPL